MPPFLRLSAYYFFYFAFLGAFAPYFSLYLDALAFSAWEIGILMSVMQAVRVVAPNLWGWLADRLGRRAPIVRLAAVAAAAGFCVFFVTRSFTGVFLGMAVMAFFWGAALPLVEALTFGHLGAQAHRYGSVRLWGSIGFILAVIGLGALLDVAPIESMLWVSLALLGGIVVCAFLVPEAAIDHPAAQGPSLSVIIRRREVASLLAACFLMSAAHGALYVFLSIHLVEHGYRTTVLGWLWSIGVLAEIIVFLLMPRLLRRFAIRDILLFSCASAVVRFLLIGWAVDHAALVVIAQLMHGATFGAYHAAAVAAVNTLFPGRYMARGQALYSSVSFGAGGMVGGALSGYAWGAFGGAVTYTVSSGIALIGILVLAHGCRGSNALGGRAR